MIDTVGLRYALVGLVNTAVGFGCIIALQQGAGIAPELANSGGFALGMLLSYLLNRRFSFRSERSHAYAVPVFMLCAGVSYVLNLLMLWTALDVLMLQPVIAQVVAVASYTISFYLLNRYVVFASHPA